jgi:hypothetical protein
MTVPHMRPHFLAVEFHVDLSPESIDGMGKVEALHAFRELLPNTVDNKY